MTGTSLDSAFATIARRVVPGSTLFAHRPLQRGVSAAVHVLELSSTAGPVRLVVRRHGAASWKQLAEGVTETEFALLAALHEAGLPVPRPRLLDLTAQLLPSPLFVMDFVAGTTDIPPGSLGSALQQMASFLARLHTLDVDALRLPHLPAREDPALGALAYIPQDAASAPLRDYLSGYAMTATQPALLHGDFWPGNMLWAGERLTAVLDWEDAALGAPASDVACCRAELNTVFGASAAHAFTQQYCAASGSELRDLCLWDLYVGSAALATMHDWGLPPEVEAQRRERTTSFVAQAAENLLLSR